MESAQELLLFIVVGVTNTVVDFVIFNLLTRPTMGWRRIPANVVSVTVAMAWSFLANWFLVFRPAGYDWISGAGKFLATTAFSAFVLQNVVLYLTTYVWRCPVNAALLIMRTLGLRANEDVVSRNTCKLLAVTAGLIWNFCWYKFFVYAK